MDYKKLEEFKKILIEADPQHLIKIGAPLDEYDHEALYLYEHISSQDTVTDIQKKIWDHFYDSFCTGTSYAKDGTYKEVIMSKEKAITHIGTVDTYKEIAEKIKKVIGNSYG